VNPNPNLNRVNPNLNPNSQIRVLLLVGRISGSHIQTVMATIDHMVMVAAAMAAMVATANTVTTEEEGLMDITEEEEDTAAMVIKSNHALLEDKPHESP